MNIQDCFKGLCVTYKVTGKDAAVNYVDRAKGEIEIGFDNGTTARVRPSDVEPAMGGAQSDRPSGPVRPCPNCAQPIPYGETTCPSCGFQYGVQKPSSGIGKFIITLIVLGAIAFAVWKFVLQK